MIGLLSLRVTMFLLQRRLAREGSARGAPDLVDIFTSGWKFNFHKLFPVGILDLLRAAEIFGRAVITLRAPIAQISGDIARPEDC